MLAPDGDGIALRHASARPASAQIEQARRYLRRRRLLLGLTLLVGAAAAAPAVKERLTREPWCASPALLRVERVHVLHSSSTAAAAAGALFVTPDGAWLTARGACR